MTRHLMTGLGETEATFNTASDVSFSGNDFHPVLIQFSSYNCRDLFHLSVGSGGFASEWMSVRLLGFKRAAWDDNTEESFKLFAQLGYLA